MYLMRVAKYACYDIYKIDVQCKKGNNKHPCKFVLILVVKLFYVISFEAP
jgi:hypothetical protein